MFNEGLEKWYNVLQVGHVYLIGGRARLKAANRQFTHIDHDFEIQLDVDTEIVPLSDDAGIKQQKWSFVDIGKMRLSFFCTSKVQAL